MTEKILFFERIGRGDVGIVGGKNANLGELVGFSMPVPPGFAITAQAYGYFLEKNNLKQRIASELGQLIDLNDTRTLRKVGGEVRRMILGARIPADLEKEIVKSYEELARRAKTRDPFVAVRSSATAEDLPGASFAGQQETFLNVRGRKELLEKILACFASLYTDRAIFYRAQQGFGHFRVLLSVAVELMVDSRSAGVMFSLDPSTGDDTKIVIEGSWGLGEAVVSGSVTPDRFVFDKTTMRIIRREIADKKVEYLRDPVTGHTIHAPVLPERQKKPCLTDEEVRALAEYSIRIEKHYGSAQDTEWAIDRGLKFPASIFIVQTRPETVWVKKKMEAHIAAKVGVAPVCKGLPASPGAVAGVARVVPSVGQIERVKKGDILVTRMTTPDWVPAMRKAKAIVTDEGGQTCHAAIVSRELGIPCIVGTGNGTGILVDGRQYTVDAREGYVYPGTVKKVLVKEPKMVLSAKPIPTRTKVYMNLGVPEKIAEYRRLPFDGIGLFRIEFTIASYVNQHPNDLIEKGKSQFYIDKLAQGIATVAKAVKPRPVVVRFSDFKTNEYRALSGGERFEPAEANPMIGWRGVSRYVSPEFENAFRLECRAMRKVREKMGCPNVWAMLPFVRTPQEVGKCLRIMDDEGLRRGATFKVWLMLEVPSVVFMIDEFCALPIDGFSIGSNDLTQLIVGADRDSEILGRMGYFDERNPAVLRAIEASIRGALRHGKTISICGQAPSVYPEITRFLIRHGVTSISVNPDTIIKMRQIVADAEKKLR